MRTHLFYLITCMIVLTWVTDLSAQATFEGIGFLSESNKQSRAFDVSDDGNVIVGWSVSELDGNSVAEAFRWEEGVMQGLGDLPGGVFSSQSRGVSGDGSVVIGYGVTSAPTVWEAFRWSATDGMIGLGDFVENDLYSEATDVSYDGSVIVGRSYTTSKPMLWINGELQYLEEDAFGEAWGVSSDGSIVVGSADIDDVQQAFRWTQETGFEGLGAPDGGYSVAFKISADGNTVVGFQAGDNIEAFRWTEEAGMEALGFLPGGNYSKANDVSDDGATVVGIGYSGDGYVAFIWREETGIQNLKEFLETEYGLDLTGWVLGEASAISADGTTIVGSGINPDGRTEGWKVVIPTSSGGSCTAPNTFYLDEITDSSVWFSWEPSPSEVNGYNWLIMNIGNVPGVDEPAASGTAGPGTNSAFAMGLNPGTSYNVYLQTRCDDNQESNYGGPFMITTTGGMDCIAPNTFYLDEITGSSVWFSWEPSPSEVNGYNWFVMNFGASPDMDDPVAGGTTEPGISSAFANGLSPNTSYSVYIQTNCDNGEQSGYGGPFIIMTAGDGGECIPPSNIAVNTVTNTVVFVTWTENGDASQWEIEYGEAGFIQGEGTIIFDNDGSPNETIDGLTQGVEYDVYVRAMCGNSESEWVGPVTFVIEPEPCIPPTDIIVDTVNPSMVYVNWTENADATQWEIEYGETGFTQGEGTTVLDNDGTPGEAISGLQEGINYDVYVRAICEFSGSEWTGPVTFNTQDMGTNEQENQMMLYPNPTSGLTNLQTKEKINSVAVYNAAGQKVEFNSLNKENTSIDISSLPGGIYFIELNLNNKTIKRYKVIRK